MRKTIIAVTALGLALAGSTIAADAKGCIKGAVVGGVAGHYAGHHGFLGAAAGCAIGHHRAKQAERQNPSFHRSTIGSSNPGTNPPRY
jgi:hypothetical protein